MKDRQVMYDARQNGSTKFTGNHKGRTLLAGRFRFRRSWILVEIGFLLAVIALFNLFPQLIGSVRSPGAVPEFLPVIFTGFLEYLPWLNLWWGMALLLNLAILFFRLPLHYQRRARIGLTLFGLVLLIRILVSGPLMSFNSNWAGINTAGPDTVQWIKHALIPAISTAIKAVISIAILSLGYIFLQKLRGEISFRSRVTAERSTASLPGKS